MCLKISEDRDPASESGRLKLATMAAVFPAAMALCLQH